MKKPDLRTECMSFKTFLTIKKALQKLAKEGNRSMSRELERLIKEAALKSNI